MILVAGLTPAWQQVLALDSFRPGEVNRAAEAHRCASGKVLNAARALHHLGGPVRALTVAGGVTGGQMQDDFRRLGIPARWVETAAPTRVCTTVVDRRHRTATELVENARPVTAAERQAFLDAYAEEAAGAAVVVLIGSLPPGTPPDCYRELLRRTPGKAVLDARGEELLQALPGRPFLVKPNRQELAATLGRELRTEAELIAALREVGDRGAEWVLVTDGAGPAYACSAGRVYRLRPPACAVVNPIGCGDCLAAGVAWATFHGREPPDALRLGVATAADKVGRLLPGYVERERVEVLAHSVELSPVTEPAG